MAEILIVDDDEVIRDTLHELLSSDYHCETAETAERALEKLKEKSFDLILTDISMPGLSGLQLLERVLKHYPETLVIIISAMRDHEHAQELISLGAFDSVVKPLRLEVVEGSVRRAMNYRRNKTPELKLVEKSCKR